MKRLLFFLFLFALAFSATAQERIAPTISFEKNLFNINETVWMDYVGAPQPLTVILKDNTGSAVGYKAVVSSRPNSPSVLKLLPSTPWKHGSYTVEIFSAQQKLLDDHFSLGVQSSSIRRTSPRLIEPNQTVNVTLDIPNLNATESAQTYSLTETVPFEAIINDPNIVQIKTPELLNLRFPYSGHNELTLGFGHVNPDEHLGLPEHDGVDFAMEMGTPILAVDDGEIVPYREENNYGTTVALQHIWGQSFYGHLSTSSAQIGNKVRKGEVVGLSGNTGRSSGPHLHFGLKWNNEKYIDPLPLLFVSNNSRTASKQLVFERVAPSSRLTYDMTLPNLQSKVRSIELDPAVMTSSSFQKILVELTRPSFLLSPSTGFDEVKRDPFLTNKTLIATQDNVIVWKNEEQAVLKGYDTITKTSFEQSLVENADNTLTIDTKKYLIKLSPVEIKLELSP